MAKDTDEVPLETMSPTLRSTGSANGFSQTIETKQKSKTEAAKSFYEMTVRENLIPLALMAITPNAMIVVVYLVVEQKSSFQELFSKNGLRVWKHAWEAATVFDWKSWTTVLVLVLWSTASMFLGGKKYYGPPTASGYRPEYYQSGFRYYVLTLIAAFILLVYPAYLPAWHMYKQMVPLSGVLLVFGFAFCCFLYIKGQFFPSPGVHGSSGSPIFDFYWGLELYPRLGKKFHIKLWTNSRFGLMAWQLIVFICWKAQFENSGWNWAMAASSILQTVYLAKFYWWEDGYMSTIDIQDDRAGFYICWGCLYFVPTFYTLTSLYLVENSPIISWPIFAIIVISGISMIGLNYWADYQRQLARDTRGDCVIWGQPAKVIRAVYTGEKDGKKMESILLASGFWGLARHMNYFFELGVAFSWAVSAMFQHVVPYSYFIFLTILLLHRTFRDEYKCKKKYGKYWDQYCKIAKSRILPGIF